MRPPALFVAALAALLLALASHPAFAADLAVLPPIDPDVQSWADYTGIDPVDLQGAVNTTGATPEDYLVGVGEVTKEPVAPAPAPAYASTGYGGRVACIIQHESQGVATARNPSSGAAGLGQFLPGTWASTPQGKAGYSVYDPSANAAAVAWMVSVGRAREFDVVRVYGC